VLVDGRVSASETGSGVIVHELIASDRDAGYDLRHYVGTGHIEVVVPWDHVATWRVTCTCGWTGGERPAVTDAKYGTRDCPEALKDRVFLPEWQAHVEPFEAIFELGRLVGGLHEIEALIDHKVRLARSGGASWTQVGRAAGLTKQGAQQRWGHLVPEP
jgi:hypothetical protein